MIFIIRKCRKWEILKCLIRWSGVDPCLVIRKMLLLVNIHLCQRIIKIHSIISMVGTLLLKCWTMLIRLAILCDLPHLFWHLSYYLYTNTYNIMKAYIPIIYLTYLLLFFVQSNLFFRFMLTFLLKFLHFLLHFDLFHFVNNLLILFIRDLTTVHGSNNKQNHNRCNKHTVNKIRIHPNFQYSLF